MRNQSRGNSAFAELDFSLQKLRATRELLKPFVRETPFFCWKGPEVDDIFGAGTELVFKFEQLQVAGTFKPRGAFSVMLSLSAEARQRGVIAVSAGNHAIAVAYAARMLGCSARIFMPQTASQYRVERTRSFGAEVILMPDVHAAFAEGRRIADAESRTLIHPYEGYATLLGTASLGVEFFEQVGDLDAIILPVGGGGLCGGVGVAVKQIAPRCRVLAVEPRGANSMFLSLHAGEPQRVDQLRTVADTLAVPFALPISFDLCFRTIDEIMLVDDSEIVVAMKFLCSALKLAVEPAGATATAGVLGPFREQLSGKRVGVMVCGANIDPASYAKLISSCSCPDASA